MWRVRVCVCVCVSACVCVCVCVCVCAGTNKVTSHGLQCKFVLCDILSPFLPLVRPRVDLCIAHFYRTPSPPSPLVNPPACLTVISNPAGIPPLNYPSSHPSRHPPIHPSIPHSPCDVYLLSYTFINHAALPSQLFSPYFAYMCLLWPLWGIISNPLLFLSHLPLLSCVFLSLEEPRCTLQGCINK